MLPILRGNFFLFQYFYTIMYVCMVYITITFIFVFHKWVSIMQYINKISFYYPGNVTNQKVIFMKNVANGNGLRCSRTRLSAKRAAVIFSIALIYIVFSSFLFFFVILFQHCLQYNNKSWPSSRKIQWRSRFSWQTIRSQK